jgi:hypothetical protein
MPHKHKNSQSSQNSLSHDSSQVWVHVPRNIDFVNMDGTEDQEAPEQHARIASPANETTFTTAGSSNTVQQPWTTARATTRGSHKDTPAATVWHPGGTAETKDSSMRDTDHGFTQRGGFGNGEPPSITASHNVPYEPGSPAQRPTPRSTEQLLSPTADASVLQPLHRTNSSRSAHLTSPVAFGASPHSIMRSAMWNSPGNVSSPALSLTPSWPFRTLRESKLFHHYIKHISPWIDVLDPGRYFGCEIPRRAAFQPLIANAIYALASLHQSLLEEREDTESPVYVDDGLQYLKQILEDPLGHADENLLAGVILLRSHEEMSDKDENVHLLGGKRLLNSIASYAADGGFKEAASWISLRQHIYISLTTQSSLGLNLSNYEHSSVFTAQSDEAWANRAVFLFARVLNYVFGSEDGGVHSGRFESEEFTELENEVEAWNVSKPWYFSVLWAEADHDRRGQWPEAQTSTPAHAVGLQYYALCRIVLAIYDPRLTRLGFGTLKLRKASEAIVLKHLRLAVGIAVSNPDVTNAMFQGSHILAVCGSYLHDAADQEAAVEFLEGMNRTMGWRTLPIIENLREQWAT